MLNTMGAILLFLLVNIEIADYFSPPGASSLKLEFSGNFARDMSYSIAWALFALGLLIVGMIKQIKAARYAGIVLMCVTRMALKSDLKLSCQVACDAWDLAGSRREPGG
jgi:uncharacterized membrane protein